MYDELWQVVITFSTHDNRSQPCAHRPATELTSAFMAATWGMGRVMSPSGCNFMFPNAVYQQVGPFDENMRSFHEESDYGVRCAEQGMISVGLPYPRTYHASSRTFGEMVGGEETNRRFTESKRVFIDKWNIPADQREGHQYFKNVHERFMPQIPEVTVEALFPNGSTKIEHGVEPGNIDVLTPFLTSLAYTM